METCTKPVVFIHGSYFGNNFGDVLLVSLFASRIESMGYKPAFPFASHEYTNLTGVEVGRRNAADAIAGIYCGGGYFGEPSKKKRYWALRNYCRHSRSYKFFKKNRLPIGIFGVGFGPITYEPFRSFSVNIFNDASSVAVRDEKSRRYAKEYGVLRNINVLSDAVVSLSKKDIPEESLSKVDSFFQGVEGKYVIGVHLTDKYDDGEKFSQIVDGLKKSVKDIFDAHIVFIVDGASKRGRVLKQAKDARNLARELDTSSYTVWNYSGHWDMVSLISNLNMVITSKLHVGIVASAMGVNVISIPYHSKTRRFYEQIGVPERCFEGSFSGREISDFISSFYGREGVSIPEEIREDSRQNFVLLESFLRDASIQ